MKNCVPCTLLRADRPVSVSVAGKANKKPYPVLREDLVHVENLVFQLDQSDGQALTDDM